MDFELSPMHIRLKWLRQAAQGLEHMHSRGVVHGNIHALNLLLTDSLDAKLCDFGGSAMDGGPCLTWGTPPSYKVKPWTSDGLMLMTPADDVFAFGALTLSLF